MGLRDRSGARGPGARGRCRRRDPGWMDRLTMTAGRAGADSSTPSACRDRACCRSRHPPDHRIPEVAFSMPAAPALMPPMPRTLSSSEVTTPAPTPDTAPPAAARCRWWRLAPSTAGLLRRARILPAFPPDRSAARWYRVAGDGPAPRRGQLKSTASPWPLEAARGPGRLAGTSTAPALTPSADRGWAGAGCACPSPRRSRCRAPGESAARPARPRRRAAG